jgi:hypothetical protein
MGFKNIAKYDNDGISNLLELNIKEWLIDGFMEIGAIIPPRTSVLHPDTSDDLENLAVWNSPIQNWAYKALGPGGNTVLVPATITVNGVPEPNVSINYALGQVTFNRELFPDDKVEARHATNRVSILTTLELDRRPLVRLGSEAQFSGRDENFSVFEELAVSETVRTPYIIIETFPTGSASPVMLGSGAVWANRRIQLNVVAETVGELSRILDILNVQTYQSLNVFDTTRAAIDGVLPIDPMTGDINYSPAAIQYPRLVREYRLDTVYWSDLSVRKFKTTKEDIHMGIAYFTISIVSNSQA